MMRLVYFDDNPLSGLPTAKPLGRIDFYDTIMRSVLVIGTVLMRDRPSLLGAITLALMIALYLFTNMTLPYYNMKINQLRSSFYAVLVWLALGSLIAGTLMSSSTYIFKTGRLYYCLSMSCSQHDSHRTRIGRIFDHLGDTVGIAAGGRNSYTIPAL